MAEECLPRTIEDREYQKFTCTTDDQVAVRTNVEGTLQFSGLSIGGKITLVSINDSTWTALPATALANRNGLSIQNVSGQDIYLQYDNTSVTANEWVTVGNNVERYYNITDTIVVYGKASNGTVNVLIEELA